MNLKEMLIKVRKLAKDASITVEKYIECVVSFEEATATERSTKEERLATMDALREIAMAHLEEAPDPRQVVVQVGLRQCQADRAFVRHHVEKFRLEAGARQAAE